MRRQRCEYYKDQVGYWRWRVIASNGKILADSGENYQNLKDCQDGLRSMRRKFWFHTTYIVKT